MCISMSLSSPLSYSFFHFTFASLLLDGVQALYMKTKERENERKKMYHETQKKQLTGEGNGSICNQQGVAEPVPERNLAHCQYTEAVQQGIIQSKHLWCPSFPITAQPAHLSFDSRKGFKESSGHCCQIMIAVPPVPL